MEKDPNIRNPFYNKHILPVPWHLLYQGSTVFYIILYFCLKLRCSGVVVILLDFSWKILWSVAQDWSLQCVNVQCEFSTRENNTGLSLSTQGYNG